MVNNGNRGEIVEKLRGELWEGRANFFFFGPTFDLENFPTSGVKGRVLTRSHTSRRSSLAAAEI